LLQIVNIFAPEFVNAAEVSSGVALLTWNNSVDFLVQASVGVEDSENLVVNSTVSQEALIN
jgi:hypothetical protein